MAITVNQIAEQCGVSRTTVLRALNGGSVSKDTKERILQVAKDNNYRPNLLARSLNHGRTGSYIPEYMTLPICSRKEPNNLESTLSI